MPRRWTHRPAGSNWGEFGDEDQRGSLNHIGPAEVKAAIAEVREGRTFCLSLPLDYPGGSLLAPHRFPPVLRPTERVGSRISISVSARTSTRASVISAATMR
jgi:hypothetical protein